MTNQKVNPESGSASAAGPRPGDLERKLVEGIARQIAKRILVSWDVGLEFEGKFGDAADEDDLTRVIDGVLHRFIASVCLKPRCPKCGDGDLALQVISLGNLVCGKCKFHFTIKQPIDFAQFFPVAVSSVPPLESTKPCICGDGGCIECWPSNFTKEELLKHLATLRWKASTPGITRPQGAGKPLRMMISRAGVIHEYCPYCRDICSEYLPVQKPEDVQLDVEAVARETGGKLLYGKHWELVFNLEDDAMSPAAKQQIERYTGIITEALLRRVSGKGAQTKFDAIVTEMHEIAEDIQGRFPAPVPFTPKIKWDTPDKVAWLIINRLIDQSGWPTATPEARDKAHDIVQQEIETFLATTQGTPEGAK